MRLVYASALAAAIATMIPVVNAAPQAQAQEADRKVAGGGISCSRLDGCGGRTGRQDRRVHQGLEIRCDGQRLASDDRPRSRLLESRRTRRLATTPSARRSKISSPARLATRIRRACSSAARISTARRPSCTAPPIAAASSSCAGSATGRCSRSRRAQRPRRLDCRTKRSRNPLPMARRSTPWPGQVKGGRAECLINGKSVAGFNKDESVGRAQLARRDLRHPRQPQYGRDGVGAGEEVRRAERPERLKDEAEGQE